MKKILFFLILTGLIFGQSGQKSWEDYKNLAKNSIDNKLGDNWVTPEMYGAAGDGSQNDQPYIQNALNSGSKFVYMPDGLYRIDSTINIPDSVTLELSKGAYIRVNNDYDGIRVNSLSQLLGGNIIIVADTFSHSAVRIAGIAVAQRGLLVDNVNIMGISNKHLGNGIGFIYDNPYPAYVQFAKVNNCKIEFFEKGIIMQTGVGVWCNGNIISNNIIINVDYGIYINKIGGEISGNQFISNQYNWTNLGYRAFAYVSGGVRNRFNSNVVWDVPVTDTIFYFINGSYLNIVNDDFNIYEPLDTLKNCFIDNTSNNYKYANKFGWNNWSSSQQIAGLGINKDPSSTYKLDINGKFRANNDAYLYTDLYFDSVSTKGHYIRYFGSGLSTDRIVFMFNSTSVLNMNGLGRVGVLTSFPSVEFEVTGSAKISNSLVGTSYLRGTASFTTTSTIDTITITGATVNDIYIVTINKTSAPIADDMLSYQAITNGLIVRRVAGTTSGLSYSYMRIK